MTVAMFIHWRFTVEGEVDLFERADAVTAALLEQEQCTPKVQDSAVSADRGGRVMEIEVTVQAASENEAIAIGQAAIRSAIHAAGLSTSWWPSHDEVVSLLPTGLQTTRLSTAASGG
ncbi:MAG: hypothetical protein ACRDRP_12900 [Pseudonocardiaceae bacterium]